MLARRNTDTVMPGQLRVLAPFRGLPAEQLIVAAGRTSSDRFNDGEIAIALGAVDGSDYFLLDGKFLISDIDGKSNLVTAGSAEALNVIAPLRPSIYGVRASGLTLWARIPRADLAALHEQVERVNQTSLKEVETEPSATQGLMFDLEAHAVEIGALICRKWNFGDTVIEAVSENRNWAFVSHGELILAEIVICARYHTLQGLGQIQNLPKPEQIGAMRVLGGEVTPEKSLEIIKDAKERVDVLLDTLS